MSCAQEEMEADIGHVPKMFNLGGIKIEFPGQLKPYPSQLGLMAKAVTGARKAQNCLLESPTGSGKTMAMLCSLLAWQKTVQGEADTQAAAFRAQTADVRMNFLKDSLNDAQTLQPDIPTTSSENSVNVNRMQIIDDWAKVELSSTISSPVVKSEANTSTRSISPDLFSDDDDMDAFKPPKKMRLTEKSSSANTETVSICPSTPQVKIKVEMASSPFLSQETDEPTPNFKPPAKIRVPKIYFATRTHKQISQVVKELKRTPYRNVKMTILSAREHTCIRNLEEPYTNKTEMCRAYLDKEAQQKDEGHEMKLGCLYKSNMDKLNKSLLLHHLDMDSPWDIEDLVLAGKKKRCCPYFSARELMINSQIIFCPYNYVIDPLIRASMNIILKNNVVVFDEAHNIEDSIRQATSFSLEETKLSEAIKSCEVAVFMGGNNAAFTEIKKVLEIQLAWMQQNAGSLKVEDNYSSERSKILTGDEYFAHMDVKGIGEQRMNAFKEAVDIIFAGDEGASMNVSRNEEDVDVAGNEEMKSGDLKKHQLFKPSQTLRNIVEGLCLVWNMMLKNDRKNINDYNIVLYETADRYFAPQRSDGSGWLSATNVTTQVRLGLHFWCMNPALGFMDFQECHSVIVTSGTLSPMLSYQSELGVRFPHSLSAGHVINPSQAWVATVSNGPSGKEMNGTYRFAVTMEYQDEIGEAIIQICEVVPFGVLCFFPSYAMLNNVVKRWKLTGRWDRLLQSKHVVEEPRRSGDFLDAMREFDHAVRQGEVAAASGMTGGQTGGLFLGVFRGKLSEGIDFKDNHARAVITVSIPFPSMSDLNVKLKKKFNDKNRYINKNLMAGTLWYETQAYRAINQALGRCIRHRDDWGAIIMLDSRFAPGSKSTLSLSKWATKEIRHFNAWDAMHSMLQGFMHERISMQSGKPALQTETVIDLT